MALCSTAKSIGEGTLRVNGGGLARSSPRLQCPQLPPIAGTRLIPNDRRLVPTADVSKCSKTVSSFRIPSHPYRSSRSNLLLKIAASRSNSMSTVCPGCKSLSASAKARRFGVLMPPRTKSRSPVLSPALSAPDPGRTLATRTPSPWSIKSGTIPVATRRAAVGAVGTRNCAAGAVPEKFSGSGRAAR